MSGVVVVALMWLVVGIPLATRSWWERPDPTDRFRHEMSALELGRGPSRERRHRSPSPQKRRAAVSAALHAGAAALVGLGLTARSAPTAGVGVLLLNLGTTFRWTVARLAAGRSVRVAG